MYGPELVPAEIRQSAIVSSPRENFAGCTLCMHAVYSPSHPAATLEDEARGLRLRVYSRYFSRVQEFAEREGEREEERERWRKYRPPLAITARPY